VKKTCACFVCFLIIVCGTTFTKGRSRDLSPAPNISHPGVAQLAIEQLTPGEPKAGSVAAANPGNRILSETQYAIQYPGGGSKLVLEFHPDSYVDFYVRRNLPVTMGGDKVVYDFSVGQFIYQRLSLPFIPPLDAATYFIAVVNSSSRVVNFTLTASLVGPPTDDTVDLGLPSYENNNRLELGSIPMPEPNSCALGRTQYTISVADHVYCDWGRGWALSLRGDRDVNLYVRRGQRVAVEDGKVVADFESKPPTGFGQFSVGGSVSPMPTVRTYFIAVENCNPGATNYALTFDSVIPDQPSPEITNAVLDGKALLVMGYYLDSGTVLFDGEPQKTKYGGRSSGPPFPEDILIVKGARNKIRRGDTVAISVKLPGCTTPPFTYFRNK
jgi:hypothetical protein